MPLVINAGETKTIQLQAEGYHKRPRHYAGGKFIDCIGAGCQLCAAGVKVAESYALPVTIGGIADEWIFPLGVCQQLDALIQQGYRLLLLTVKVSRTGTGANTRYQVVVAAPAQPALGPQPTPSPGAVASAIAPVQPSVAGVHSDSVTVADRWARLTQRLLYCKDFLELVAKEVQAMKDDGAWR